MILSCIVTTYNFKYSGGYDHNVYMIPHTVVDPEKFQQECIRSYQIMILIYYYYTIKNILL